MQYQWIFENTLRPIHGNDITAFRNRITAMESIRFGNPMALEWEAALMFSEGCVTCYLDRSQQYKRSN